MIFPSLTARIISAERIVESLCAITNDVLRGNLSDRLLNANSVIVSTEEVASSSTRMRGSASRARAKDQLFSPVESRSPPSPTAFKSFPFFSTTPVARPGQAPAFFIVSCVRISVKQIMRHSCEQIRRLQYVPDAAVQQSCSAPGIASVDQHPPCVGS